MNRDNLLDWFARIALIPILMVALPLMGIAWLIFRSLALMEKKVGNFTEK